MKDIQKVFETKKYGIIIIYFNFIIALNLIINVVLSRSSDNDNDSTTDSNGESQEDSEKIQNNLNIGFSWGGYIAALIFLNSIFIIKCKLIKENWHFWIKQTFLSITLLLVILVMNLGENQSKKQSIQEQIQKTQKMNANYIYLYCDVKYQTGQISLFSLISLIEVLPFQFTLILVNQIYFIFIRQEIYSTNYTDQIIFFAIYPASIFIFIFLQRLQNKLLRDYNEFNGKQIILTSNIRKNNISSVNFDLQPCLQNPVFKGSFQEGDNVLNNEIKQNYEGSYTQRSNNLLIKDTFNNNSSRPLFKTNTFQKDISQINESIQHLSKNIFEEQEPIFQSSSATYEMKFSGDFQKPDSSRQICTFHKIQLNKEQNLLRNQKNKQISFNDKNNLKENCFQNDLSFSEDYKECTQDCLYSSLHDKMARVQKKYQSNMKTKMSNSEGNDHSKTNIVECDITFQDSNINKMPNSQLSNAYRTRKISHFRDDGKQDNDNQEQNNQIMLNSNRQKSISLKEMKQNVQNIQKQINFQPLNISTPIIQNQMYQNQATINNSNKSINNKFFNNNYINNKQINSSLNNNIFNKNGNINQEYGNKIDNAFDKVQNNKDQYQDKQNRTYSEFQNYFKDNGEQSMYFKSLEQYDKNLKLDNKQKEYGYSQENSQQENQNLRFPTTNSIYNNGNNFVSFNQNVSYMVQQPHQQVNKNQSTSGSYAQFQDGNVQTQHTKNVNSNESYNSIDNPQNISLDCASISYDIRQRPSIFSKKTIKRCNSMDHTQMKKFKRQNSKYARRDSDCGDDHIYQKSVFGLDKFQILNGAETNSIPHRPQRHSETSYSPQFSHRNLSVIYQVFFNFFPEGIVFIDSDLNVVYSNNSSKLLMDCKDNNQLKEVIFNLPNVKTEIEKTQQQQEDTQFDSRHKVSFESFRNLNNASPRSTDQMFAFNHQNQNSNISVNSPNLSHNTILLNQNYQSEKNNKTRYLISDEQSPNRIYSKRIQSMHLGGGQSSYQSSRMYMNDNNQHQTTKSSNQVNLQQEIIKNLQKTHNYIQYHNMDTADSNMILNETITFNSKYKKSNLNYVTYAQNYNNNAPNSNQNHYQNSQHSIKLQMNSNAAQNTPTMNNGVSTVCYTPRSKEKCNSFYGVIANSIYASTHFPTPPNSIISNQNNNSSTITANTHQNNTFLNNPTQQQHFNIPNISTQLIQQNSNLNILNNSNSIPTPNSTNNQINQINNGANTSKNRKSSIQIQNGCSSAAGSGAAPTNNYPQVNYSFMNFQVSQQFLEKGNTHQQENINEYRELEICLFPSVVEGKAMMLVMIRDVTHRKYIQHLKMANLHKQQIVSYLSHELRNPLNCIINMLDTAEYDIQLLKRIDQNQINVEEIENNIVTALQNSKYILNLSNDYLDMARIKAEQFKLNIQPFNLLNLLQDCMKLFSIQAYKVNTQIILKNKSIKNGFYFDSANQFQNMIYSDSERIKQVVINLISNALKFTHNGRIVLIVEYNTISSVQISIKDSGVGIEKSKIKSLFKAFGKIDDEDNQQLNQQGVGLGLLISNMLSIQLSKPPSYQDNQVNQNNTNSLLQINTSAQIPQQSQQKQEKGLKVQSEKGNGSTFTLTVTDHNPYFRQNKTLGRQAIQQIAETQESSALLSQSFFENPAAKKSQFETNTKINTNFKTGTNIKTGINIKSGTTLNIPANQKTQSSLQQGTNLNIKTNLTTGNMKTATNIGQQMPFKKSSQNIKFTQSQNTIPIGGKTPKKLLKDGGAFQFENNISSIVLDNNSSIKNPDKTSIIKINLDHIKSSTSFTQVSYTDFSEHNINEYQNQYIIYPNPINYKNNLNLNRINESHSSSPLQLKAPKKLEKIQKQYLIKSSQDLTSTIANSVKNYPSIKNKFVNNKPSEEKSFQISPIQIPNHINFNHKSPPSSTSNSPMKSNTIIRGKQQSIFSGQQMTIGDEEILIVDDNIFCCEALKNIIEKRFGLSCLICFSAMRAVEAVKERFSNSKKAQTKEKIKQKISYYSEDQVSDSSPKDKKNIEPSIILQSPTKKESNSQYTLSNKVVDSEETLPAETRFFKFIFLDINMPDVDGFEGLYQIKSFLNQVYPNFSDKCQIIGCSGIDENYVEEQYLANNNPLAQFDGFLFKPVLKEKLIEFFSSYNITMLNR